MTPTQQTTPGAAATPAPSPRRPGVMADPSAPPESWGGRKAQQYVQLTLDTFGRTCALCGLPGATTANHIIPRAKGGAVYVLANLEPAHKSCNESLGARGFDGTPLIESGLAFFSRA